MLGFVPGKNNKEQADRLKMERLRASFTSDPEVWSHIRILLKDVLEIHQVSDRESNMIALAVDEAFTNVFRHAYDERTCCPIDLRVSCDGNQLTVELQDYGRKCDASKIKSRDLDEIRPGGLGVHIIKSVFDDVQYDTSPPEGTVLRMKKTFEGNGSWKELK